MFESALKEYALIVRGNPAYVGIIFHTVVGVLLGALVFLLINVGGQASLPLYDVITLKYNDRILFLLDSKRYFDIAPPVTIQLKILEFMGLTALIIILTSFVTWLRRKSALSDALSSIRKKLLGKWNLKLEDFAQDGNRKRDFSCGVEFGETEARKLKLRFYQANELDLEGYTSHVALYIPEGGDHPNIIEMSFPLTGNALKGDQAEEILYWISVTYMTFKEGDAIQFKGRWHHIMNNGDEFLRVGTARLVRS